VRKGGGFRDGGWMGSRFGVKGEEDIFPRSNSFNLAERVAKMIENDREHSYSTFYKPYLGNFKKQTNKKSSFPVKTTTSHYAKS
jgi:hypothetical protein